MIRFIYFISCPESENSLIYATPANPNEPNSIHPMSARKTFIPPNNSFKNSLWLHLLIATTCVSTVSIKICPNRKSMSLEIGRTCSAVDSSSFSSREESMKIIYWAVCRKRRKMIGRNCWKIIKGWFKNIN